MTNTATGTSPENPSRDRRPSAWTSARIIAAVLGSLMILASYPALITGAGLMTVDHMARDDGYLTAPSRTFHTDGNALVSEGIDADTMHGSGIWMMRHVVGDVRVRVESANGEPIFAGIAPTEEAMAYVRGLSFEVVDADGTVVRREIGQAHMAMPPMTQPMWTVSVRGRGQQKLSWRPQQGKWSLVVMPPSGRPGIDVRMDVGAEAPSLTPAAWTSLALGALLLTAGTGLAIVAVHQASGGKPARHF